MNREKIKLNIDENMFSKVYWKICNINTRFRIVYGGSGSGKSRAVVQDEILKACETKVSTLVIRKYSTSIEGSIFKNFNERIKEFGLTPFARTTKKPLYIKLSIGNKQYSEFLFSGLDDPEKLKSIEGIGRIVVEEANELEYDDFKELNRRVRGIPNIQITLMFNPIDEDHWINSHFFKNKLDRATIVHSTHWDNEFLLPEDHEEIEALKFVDENQYNIYALGLWGKLKTGSEFFPRFSKIQHTGEVKFLPHLGVHQSWDFNWLPYQPMCLFQIAENVKRWERRVILKDTKGNDVPTIQRFKEHQPDCREIYVTQIRAFKNYSFRPPVNDVDNVCSAYIQDYGNRVRDLFLYGDASGKSNVPGHGDGANFKRIKKNLAPFLNQASDRVNIVNPSVTKSRDFMNKVFANWYPIEFIADKESCADLIGDIESVLLGKDGMLKEMEKDKKTGISYQKRGHYADLTRYLFTKVFSDLFKANI
jgi:PBSX family phage terminase large subunit